MKRFISITLALILAVLVLLLAWGLIEPYRLAESTFEVGLPDLPSGWSGQEVAIISDLQVGMWLDNTATIARAAQQLADRQPAAVVIAGDFIYHGQPQATQLIHQVVELLEPLTAAGMPVYAVLGNHDYAVTAVNRVVDNERASRLEAALEAAGIQVLRNEAVPLELAGNRLAGDPDASRLYLVGIDSHMAAKADIDQAFTEVQESNPRIVVMHHPDTFGQLPAAAAPLAVAGHTHGGQIRLPFTPEWSMLTFVKEEAVHADGWIEDYGQPGNRLYVSRGIGFSIVPLRINCPPEVTYFRLQATAAAFQ